MTLNPLAALMACVTAIFGFTTLYGAPRGLSEPLSTTPTTVWVDNGYVDAPMTTTTIPTTVASCDDAIAVAEAVGWPVEELDTLRTIMSRCPYDPLFHRLPLAYLTAWRIHSSMPGRGPGARPSALPM